MASRNPPLRSYAPAETKAALVAAALELFAEKGFRGTSMLDVAKRAGVTKGAFYHHFASKEEVLEYLHQEFNSIALRAQEEAVKNIDDLEQLLEQLVHDLVLVTLTYREHITIFFRELHELHGERRATILAERRQVTDLYCDVIRRGQAEGIFDDELDAGVAARGIIGMCAWAYQWFRSEDSLSPEDIAQQYTQMALASLRRSERPKRPLAFDVLESVSAGV